MPNLFTRTIATLLWLSERFEKIKKSKYGLVSIFVFVFVAGLVVATPVHAQDVISSLLMIFANLAISVAALLSKLVIAIIEILIPVMLYNNFSTSPVVSMGWAIVRDTVNMFFVIVLIVIAFGTIFGHSKFQWQQQVPKLMIFALVINFSKTLCGLMIDVGQVIMLTFANALREVAAGNFLQMLGLTDIYGLSQNNSIFQEAAKSSTAEGAKAFDWFASSLASLFMMLAVLVTMIMLLVILVYRVVMLWVLIVISPIAWFIGGAKGLISSNAYDDWWNKFKCLVAIGPILTFFLWLTLVVAGAGNIANDSGFDTSSGDSGLGDSGLGGTAGGMLTTIFELDKLISFVIGIAMLYAGFEAAQSACSSMTGGFLGTALKKGSPQASLGIAKGVAGAGAKVGGWGARKAGAGIKFAGGGALKMAGAAVEDNKYLGLLTKKGRGNLYKNLAGKTGNTLVGKIAGRKLSNMSDTLGAKRREEISKAGEKYKGDSTDTKADQLIRMGENPPATVGGKREAQALLMEAMKNPKLMAKLRASGKFGTIWDAHGGGLEKDMEQDDEATENIRTFKKSNADLTGSANLIKSNEDVRSLSKEAFANADVQEKLKNVKSTIRGKDGEFLSAHDAAKQGHYGTDQADFINKAGPGLAMEKMFDSELRRVESDRLVEHGSPNVLARGVDLALKGRDTDKADQILSKILGVLQDSKTTPEKRTNANLALDRIQTGLVGALANKNVRGADKDNAEKLLKNLEPQRKVAQREQERDSMKKGDFSANPLNSSADIERFISDLHIEPAHAQAGVDVLKAKREEYSTSVVAPTLQKVVSAPPDLGNPTDNSALVSALEDIQRYSASDNPNSHSVSLIIAKDTKGMPQEVVEMLEKQDHLSQGVEKLTTLINEQNSTSAKV